MCYVVSARWNRCTQTTSDRIDINILSLMMFPNTRTIGAQVGKYMYYSLARSLVVPYSRLIAVSHRLLYSCVGGGSAFGKAGTQIYSQSLEQRGKPWITTGGEQYPGNRYLRAPRELSKIKFTAQTPGPDGVLNGLRRISFCHAASASFHRVFEYTLA